MRRRRTPLKRFGEKLRAIRHSRGMTLKDLAGRLGYESHGHLSRIENGKEKPTVDLVLLVSRSFGVSCDDLLKDELEIDVGR